MQHPIIYVCVKTVTWNSRHMHHTEKEKLGKMSRKKRGESQRKKGKKKIQKCEVK